MYRAASINKNYHMQRSPVPELSYLLEEAKRIAKLAGETLMYFYDDLDQSESFLQHKVDKSPVTEADMASHNLIKNELAQLNLIYPVISEEEASQSFEKRQHYSRVWIVDPLDGTKEFLAHNGEFTVHIGLAEYGWPILGVVYAPAKNTLYYGIKHNGSYMQKGNESPLRLEANNLNLNESGIQVVHSRSHMSDGTQLYINTLDQPKTTAMGSSLKILEIAAGNQDIYPKIQGRLMEWDTCAPQVILEEAGGMIVCVERGKPLMYNKEILDQPDFLAMGKLIAYPEH
jgi:3'(2'), 5'-bisphosphate nucleotidase